MLHAESSDSGPARTWPEYLSWLAKFWMDPNSDDFEYPTDDEIYARDIAINQDSDGVENDIQNARPK